MKSVLQQAFEAHDLGVCVKDSEGKVLQQNKVCLGICGDCVGKVCNVACMELYAKDKSRQWNNWGSHVYNNSYAHGDFYDITLLCNDVNMITFLQPLEEKYKKALTYYQKMELTKREMEIFSYIIKGASNSEICEQLSVSRATLKTHLNNVYKKVNDKGMELKYLPGNRLLITKE
jgi:DNA-binding CsgD family transcriptional regulator